MTYGFVYIWYDIKRKMYYIGSHWGTEDDGYICSSKRMREAYRRRPEDFKRRIIGYSYVSRYELFEQEQWWLDKIILGKRYYNLQKIVKNHWVCDDSRKVSIGEKIRNAPGRSEKISKALKGKRRKPLTEEHKAKISKTHKANPNSGTWQKGRMPFFSDEHKLNISKAKKAKNYKHSEETLNKIKAKRATQVFSEETRAKMRASRMKWLEANG